MEPDAGQKPVKETSDAALKEKTGKTWAEWFEILDQAGAISLSHPQIAHLLSEQHQVPAWWCQQITGGYERARGLRARHEMPDGYQVSASRTLNADLETVYKTWADDATRLTLLGGGDLKISKANPGKAMRGVWKDQQKIDINFYDKGQGKSQVTIQHSRIPDAQEAEEMKAFWGRTLDMLKEILYQTPDNRT